jgi:hypothetical protein
VWKGGKLELVTDVDFIAEVEFGETSHCGLELVGAMERDEGTVCLGGCQVIFQFLEKVDEDVISCVWRSRMTMWGYCTGP